jgi:hypothetical protein
VCFDTICQTHVESGWLAGLVGWLAGRLAGWLAGRLIGWLFGCLVGWFGLDQAGSWILTHYVWVVGWLVVWLLGWLAGLGRTRLGARLGDGLGPFPKRLTQSTWVNEPTWVTQPVCVVCVVLPKWYNGIE